MFFFSSFLVELKTIKMEIKEDAGGEASQVKLLNRVMSIQQTSCFICGKQDKKINMGNPRHKALPLLLMHCC